MSKRFNFCRVYVLSLIHIYGAALLPIGVFLVIFLGSGIITGDFYAMPAIVAFLIALMIAFLQNRGLSFEEKISVISKGVGDENIITMRCV